MIPVALAGAAALLGAGGGALASILGQNKLYAVVRLQGGQVVGKVFGVLDDAKIHQTALARKGYGSIIVQKVKGAGGTYTGFHPVRAMTPDGRPVHPATFRTARDREMPGLHVRRRPWQGTRHYRPGFGDIDEYESLAELGRERGFDTLEEQEKVSLVTTRFPTPQWAIEAEQGPYPADYIEPDRHMEPILPLYRDTTSSHEWDTSVKSVEVPGRYFPGYRQPAQPQEMVVTHRPQFTGPTRGRGAI